MIFELFCGQNDYSLSREAKMKLAVLMRALSDNKTDDFGNGRLVRNIFEEVMNSHAMRVAYQEHHDEDDLELLEADDINFVRSRELVDAPPKVSELRWIVSCPTCQRRMRVTVKYIDRTVVCKACQAKFVSSWVGIQSWT